ncbi:MAG TPA: alginate export family protein, partial [Gemmataceae bacterium]|nr:alginate export family protein [Gemmataceae bacterium]
MLWQDRAKPFSLAFNLALAAIIAAPSLVSAQAPSETAPLRGPLGLPSDQGVPGDPKIELLPPTEKDPAKPPPSFWEKNPPYRSIPKLGNLPVLPSGPGNYSLRDWWEGNYREAPPKFPYPRFAVMPFDFYDVNFNYLDSPSNQEHDWSDCLHRIHLGDNWLLSSGGEVRYMYMNFNSFALSGKDDDKNLLRTRVYGDLWFRDRFRVFVEFLDAQSYGNVLPPQVTDVDHSDLMNAFIDVKIADIADKPTYLRVGRQTVYLGSQRLLGQLDWVNTNRTFQGARAFRQGEKFDVDMFYLQPVIPNATKFDWVDTQQTLSGLWTTYRPQKGHFIDVYDMVSRNRNETSKLGLNTGSFDLNTLGARYLGNKDETFYWDFEAMFQTGQQGSAHNILAQAATAGLGWHWKDAPLNPTVWAYFDYASGDHNPGAGRSTTFNQLFPFGHYYLGWLDLVGRQNIIDPNLHLYLYPTNWTTIWIQYHHFWLANANDALYNAAGNPILRDPTGRAGRDVGDEFDFTVNFTLSKHTN